MNIEKTTFGKFQDAYKLTLGEQEMVVVTEVGPRIASLALAGGENILLEDPEQSIGRKDWRIYGGHRFWVGPETEETYHPDNAPCEVETGDGFLRVKAPAERSGLQKTLEIRACEGCGGFVVRHVLTNTGDMLYHGAIWALTCVKPARLVVPWGEGTEGNWFTNMVRYWRHWSGCVTDIESAQWQQRNEYFMIEPTGEVGKAGLYSHCGMIARLTDEGTFVKRVEPDPAATYPDGNCNIELYTNPRFCEMETLSPMRSMCPGGVTTHTECWKLTAQTFAPDDWRAMETLVKDA